MLETGGNGKRNGKGTLTIPDGFKYEGEWKDDKFWTGLLHDKNGNIHQKFGNGKPLKQYPTLKPTPHHPLLVTPTNSPQSTQQLQLQH